MHRITRLLSIISFLFLFTLSSHAYSETINISSKFSSSSGNDFINTTPQGGFCIEYSQQCSGNKTYSISLALTASLMQDWILAYGAPQDAMYYKMPGALRSVKVTNAEHKSVFVHFRFAGLAATYSTHFDWTVAQHADSWVGGAFINAPGPCISSGVGVPLERKYIFMWKWPENNVACYKTPVADLHYEPYLISDMSIVYELRTPDPFQLAPGDYKGTLHFTIGPGGDMDFGDRFVPSDSNLDINFLLTVNHEFKITTSAEDRMVALQPCKPGQVCSAKEGEANWERWMVSRVTPQLTGRSNFGITSSGDFTVYLACMNSQMGQDCALESDNTAQQVPFSAFINLPANIVDSTTGAAVVQQRLYIGKDPAKNLFTTKTYAQNQKGSIDFLVAQHDVDTMLSTRPDTYRGGATVIFDQNIN